MTDEFYNPSLLLGEEGLQQLWPNNPWYSSLYNSGYVYYPALDVTSGTGTATTNRLGRQGREWFQHPDAWTASARVNRYQGRHNMKWGGDLRAYYGEAARFEPINLVFNSTLTANSSDTPDIVASGNQWASFMLGALDGQTSARLVPIQNPNALIWGQHPSGGWNYFIDFAGERSTREWYDTVGRNGWRLEEFQHYWGNAAFDDAGTADAARFLLRLYMEKRDPQYKPALDKAIDFFVSSQYPIGAWPQRFPKSDAPAAANDYTAHLTFNDDVAAENVEFLVLCYQALGDRRLLDPIVRGMNAFLVTQLGPPQSGWAMQYTPDSETGGGADLRAERPHDAYHRGQCGSAAAVLPLDRRNEVSGANPRGTRLARLRPIARGPGLQHAHASHIRRIGHQQGAHVHRTGSNVVNGRYYADYDPGRTLGHYSAFRRIDVAALRRRYEETRALAPAQATKGSPPVPGAGVMPLPRFFVATTPVADALAAGAAVATLNSEGYWPARLGSTSHPFKGPGSSTVAPGDFSETQVGDETDTSPYPDDQLVGISTAAYIRNMSVLIRALDAGER